MSHATSRLSASDSSCQIRLLNVVKEMESLDNVFLCELMTSVHLFHLTHIHHDSVYTAPDGLPPKDCQ
jgi:hypothetical protein